MNFENIVSHNKIGFIKFLFVLDYKINEFLEIDEELELLEFIENNKEIKKFLNYKECTLSRKSVKAISRFVSNNLEVYEYLNRGALSYFCYLFSGNIQFLDILDSMNVEYEEFNVKELS